MPPPILEWASSRLTWFTLPLAVWLFAFIVARLFRRRPRHAAWGWTLIAALVWAFAGTMAYFFWAR